VERRWVVSADVKNPEGLATGAGGVPVRAHDLSAEEDIWGLNVHVLGRLDRG
jgi:hypothetical protein